MSVPGGGRVEGWGKDSTFCKMNLANLSNIAKIMSFYTKHHKMS